MSAVDVPANWRKLDLLKCSNPYFPRTRGEDGSVIPTFEAYGCGKCLMCISKRFALITTRARIEAGAHSNYCMLTLTYSGEALPENYSLVREDMVLFMKRLRYLICSNSGEVGVIRALYCGEYGGRTGRPHYHVLLFGAGAYSVFGDKLFGTIVDEAWGHGFVHVEEVPDTRFGYIAKYQAKLLVEGSGKERYGRVAPFLIGSRRPGIGVPGIQLIAANMYRCAPSKVEEARETGIVPHEFIVGGKRKPLGGVMTKFLRWMLGVSVETMQVWSELEQLRSTSVVRSAFDSYRLSSDFKEETQGVVLQLADMYSSYVEPYLQRKEARDKLFSSGGDPL